MSSRCIVAAEAATGALPLGSPCGRPSPAGVVPSPAPLLHRPFRCTFEGIILARLYLSRSISSIGQCSKLYFALQSGLLGPCPKPPRHSLRGCVLQGTLSPAIDVNPIGLLSICPCQLNALCKGQPLEASLNFVRRHWPREAKCSLCLLPEERNPCPSSKGRRLYFD